MTGIVNVTGARSGIIGTITAAPAGTVTEGTAINHVENAVNTRVALSITANPSTYQRDFWSFSYDKTVASSNLVVTAFVPMFANYSAILSVGFKYASTEVWCGLYPISAAGLFSMVHGVLTGHTTTGSQTLAIIWETANDEAGQKPATSFCPNATDSSHLNQTVATATVYEKLTA